MKQTEILTHATHVNGWEPAVYMSCMSQNFRLFHVSNLSVRNFRIFLLIYTGSLIGREVRRHSGFYSPIRPIVRCHGLISVVLSSIRTNTKMGQRKCDNREEKGREMEDSPLWCSILSVCFSSSDVPMLSSLYPSLPPSSVPLLKATKEKAKRA